MKQGVQNIIFDLGGVILDVDYQLTASAFGALGISNFETEFSQASQQDFFDRFETGLADEAEFFEYARARCGWDISDQQIIDAWNAMLLRIPLRRLQILQQLQLHYNTFLLSNTNVIHETAFNKMLKEVCGFTSLAVFFDKVYYSHHIGLRKPDEAVFKKILEENNLDAAQTLFIDDSIQHIRAAEGLGIQTIHLLPGMSIEHDIFKSKQ